MKSTDLISRNLDDTNSSRLRNQAGTSRAQKPDAEFFKSQAAVNNSFIIIGMSNVDDVSLVWRRRRETKGMRTSAGPKNILYYLPTRIRFAIGGERVTCRESNSLTPWGEQNSLTPWGLSTSTWSGRAPWNHSLRSRCTRGGGRGGGREFGQKAEDLGPFFFFSYSHTPSLYTPATYPLPL